MYLKEILKTQRGNGKIFLEALSMKNVNLKIATVKYLMENERNKKFFVQIYNHQIFKLAIFQLRVRLC